MSLLGLSFVWIAVRAVDGVDDVKPHVSHTNPLIIRPRFDGPGSDSGSSSLPTINGADTPSSNGGGSGVGLITSIGINGGDSGASLPVINAGSGRSGIPGGTTIHPSQSSKTLIANNTVGNADVNGIKTSSPGDPANNIFFSRDSFDIADRERPHDGHQATGGQGGEGGSIHHGNLHGDGHGDPEISNEFPSAPEYGNGLLHSDVISNGGPHGNVISSGSPSNRSPHDTGSSGGTPSSGSGRRGLDRLLHQSPPKVDQIDDSVEDFPIVSEESNNDIGFYRTVEDSQGTHENRSSDCPPDSQVDIGYHVVSTENMDMSSDTENKDTSGSSMASNAATLANDDVTLVIEGGSAASDESDDRNGVRRTRSGNSTSFDESPERSSQGNSTPLEERNSPFDEIQGSTSSSSRTSPAVASRVSPLHTSPRNSPPVSPPRIQSGIVTHTITARESIRDSSSRHDGQVTPPSEIQLLNSGAGSSASGGASPLMENGKEMGNRIHLQKILNPENTVEGGEGGAANAQQVHQQPQPGDFSNPRSEFSDNREEQPRGDLPTTEDENQSLFSRDESPSTLRIEPKQHQFLMREIQSSGIQIQNSFIQRRVLDQRSEEIRMRNEICSQFGDYFQQLLMEEQEEISRSNSLMDGKRLEKTKSFTLRADLINLIGRAFNRPARQLSNRGMATLRMLNDGNDPPPIISPQVIVHFIQNYQQHRQYLARCMANWEEHYVRGRSDNVQDPSIPSCPPTNELAETQDRNDIISISNEAEEGNEADENLESASDGIKQRASKDGSMKAASDESTVEPQLKRQRTDSPACQDLHNVDITATQTRNEASDSVSQLPVRQSAPAPKEEDNDGDDVISMANDSNTSSESSQFSVRTFALNNPPAIQPRNCAFYGEIDTSDIRGSEDKNGHSQKGSGSESDGVDRNNTPVVASSVSSPDIYEDRSESPGGNPTGTTNRNSSPAPVQRAPTRREPDAEMSSMQRSPREPERTQREPEMEGSSSQFVQTNMPEASSPGRRSILTRYPPGAPFRAILDTTMSANQMVPNDDTHPQESLANDIDHTGNDDSGSGSADPRALGVASGVSSRVDCGVPRTNSGITGVHLPVSPQLPDSPKLPVRPPVIQPPSSRRRVTIGPTEIIEVPEIKLGDEDLYW